MRFPLQPSQFSLAVWRRKWTWCWAIRMNKIRSRVNDRMTRDTEKPTISKTNWICLRAWLGLDFVDVDIHLQCYNMFQAYPPEVQVFFLFNDTTWRSCWHINCCLLTVMERRTLIIIYFARCLCRLADARVPARLRLRAGGSWLAGVIWVGLLAVCVSGCAHSIY